MSKVPICDLCGRQMSLDPSEGKYYKIKQYRATFWSSGWVTIDAHDECVRELLDNAYARKRAMEATT